MSITKQDIINSALLAFGNTSLKSSPDSSLELKYKISYQQLASMEYWNFLQTINTLGVISDNHELFGFKYKYLKPTNAANIFSIFNNNKIDRDYKVIGEFIYANLDEAKCQYTVLDDPFSLPSYFANCLIYLLASQLCLSLGSSSSQPSLIQQYQESLREARLINGKDVPSLKYTNNYYSRARI